MNTIEDKRLYIYNLVVKYKDNEISNTLLYYIRSNNISFSENINGFFINLSLLEDEHVCKIYNLIKILENEGIDEIMCDSGEESLEDKDISESLESLVLTDKEKELIEYTKRI
jgi:hypothetical protein